MTIKKITSFRFPVGEKELSQDAYYKALSETKSGFYPFGINGIWHGGIHIDESVLRKIDNDDQMLCMANGEVIAYRINDVYPKAVYQEIKVPCKGQLVAYFSSGFTLVRHYLQMPKIAGSTDTPPTITLYSLYMHQLDWYGYQQRMQNSETEILSPKFWSVTSGRVSPDTTEIIKGSVIRINGSKTEIVGLLLKDSKIRLGERKGTNWYKIVSISEGSVVTSQGVTSELGDIQGYVFSGDVTPVPTDKSANATIDYQVVKEDNNAIGKAEVKVKGITVYASANEKQKLAYLPNTATFLFNGQENGYAKIRQISGCYVPVALNNPNGDQDSPHQGYVKISSLSSLTFEPERLDEIVVLKTPIPISKGEFIGYLGHNVSQKERFDESEEVPLATTRRVSDNKLPKLAHIELFTCDDLPAFINQTRALADNLPESDKTIVLIEKDARLTQETEPDGSLNTGLGINFIGDVNNYYVKIKPEYTLDLPTLYFNPTRVFPFLFNTTVGGIFDSINVDTQDTNDKPKKYTLTQADKSWLIDYYQSTYPELTINDIPDEVDLMSDVTRILSRDNSDNTFTISFILENKHYWIKSVDVVHLQGESGQLNTKIDYWHNFPLSLGNLPEATEKDTVYYPRTLSIDSLSHDYSTIAIDENNAIWVFVTAGNKQGSPIKGWVNTATDAQEHIKRVTPWHWSGFNTIEEKATISELSKKLNLKRSTKLDIDDCTETMLALLRIFKQSPININNIPLLKNLPEEKKNVIDKYWFLSSGRFFTIEQYKDALRTSWTAEQIGHLLLKYESEWYADEALSKWNEIDDLFEDEKQQKKKALEEALHKAGIIKPHERNYALEKLEEAHEIVKSNWQIEKEQRIKPSLWWKQVAELQAQEEQTTSDNQTNTNDDTPQITNLSSDGKAWFIHPVAMVDYFAGDKILFRKGDKHEIIREINIRLAGFGGNVPTDEFTERTEKMIKQFQRDYMKVEETGVVDMKVIEAIDKFQEEYAISDTVWSQIKCKCSPKKCSGFGNSLGQNTSPEKSNPYEYPGIHRSLLFGFCALNFYLGRQDVYKFRLISSGYRCSQHPEGKKTSNHRGKALDIQFYKNSWAIGGLNKNNIEPLLYIRDNFFKTYLNTQNEWDKINLFTTEPIGLTSKGEKKSGHTYSWIHVDVRSFEKQYLLDEYFCTNDITLNKEKLITLIKS
ncbi:hypothetical protein A9G11_09785 [Gilliamella sp. wkB108]|uniref:peptidoglycan-binding domain-containing protein n=1 Tax=Gilliamella sp. wkB108 TaxID=3120256 RepID=UPI00080EB687|nr:peptidoglycan-binding domain-containing protein [Gilliamella apicola]OCG20174.1 hypothetical protein A9G11_09785 [Gilliamella apicola]